MPFNISAIYQHSLALVFIWDKGWPIDEIQSISKTVSNLNKDCAYFEEWKN